MADPDYNAGKFPRLVTETDQLSPGPGPLKGGGGGDTFDPMEPRVKALEDKFARIETKLDGIAIDMAYVKGKIEGMPTAMAFGELKGRVDSLPTTAKAATLLGLAVAAMTAILRWGDLMAFFKGP